MNITLQDILNHNGSPLDFAASRGLILDQLLTWWRSEETQSQVRALEEFTQTLTRLRASLHASQALDRLTQLLTPDTSPVEARRSATLILRHTKHPKRPSGSPSLREGAGGWAPERDGPKKRAKDQLHDASGALVGASPATRPPPTIPTAAPLSAAFDFSPPSPTSLLFSRAGRALQPFPHSGVYHAGAPPCS